MKIAVFRALQIGDLLCTIPAFRALRSAYPHAEIVLISLPWAHFLIDRFPYIDRLIPFSGFPGLVEQSFNPKKVLTFIETMQAEEFDLLLQMHDDGSIVNPFMQLFNAKQTVGFYRREDYYPPFTPAVEYPDYGAEIHRMLTLVKEMDIPLQGDYLEFPLTLDDFDEVNHLPCVKTPYVCIHLGTHDKKRHWPNHFFSKTADYCAKKGYGVIITGVKEEFFLGERIRKQMRFPVINLAGKTTLGGMGALIQKANALISSNTDALHIAAALNTPSLTLSVHVDIEQWSPLNTIRHRVINWQKTSSLQTVFTMLDNLLNSQQLRYYESVHYSHATYCNLTHQ